MPHESAHADSPTDVKLSLRYPVPPYGIQSDAGAGLAVSYAAKEAKPR